MYYVLHAAILTWRNRYVQAELVDYGIYVGRGKKRHYVPVPDTEPHWWDATPLVVPPPPLTFAVHPRAPMLDNYHTGTIFDLYSEKLIAILEDAQIAFETFPATLVDDKTKERLAVAYRLFHLLETFPAIDEAQSDMNIGATYKLVLTNACLQTHKPLVRVQGHGNVVLIHQDLKATLDAAGITGCKYTPVDTFQVGVHMIKNLDESSQQTQQRERRRNSFLDL